MIEIFNFGADFRHDGYTGKQAVLLDNGSTIK